MGVGITKVEMIDLLVSREKAFLTNFKDELINPLGHFKCM